MKLVTKRLVLRDMREDDLSSLVSQINNIEVTKHLLVVPYPYTMRDGREWVEKTKENISKKPRKDYSFMIELKCHPGIIGSVGLHHIDRYQGKATAGCWLGQEYWRQGYMSEAVERLVRFAFNTLGLRRIETEAFVENIASNTMQQKLGFQLEGTKIQSARCKATGKIHDANQYGMLRDEWIRNH